MKSKFLKKGLASLLSATLGLGLVVLTPITSISAAPTAIDPSKRSEWIIYDHSDQNQAWWTAQGYNAQSPFQQQVDGQVGNRKVTTWDQAIAMTQVSSQTNHIWVNGNASQAEVLFQGYGVNAYTDFMIYPSTSSDVKTIGFDVDMMRANPHTLGGFGAIVNAGIDAGGLLTGDLIYYVAGTAATLDVYHARISGVSASNISSGSVSLLNIARAGNKIGTYQGGQSLQNKYRIEMQIETDSIIVQQDLYKADKITLENSMTILNGGVAIQSPNPEKYYGFGFFADYVGHNCTQLSTLLYGKMQLAVNYSVVFDSQGGSAVVPDRIDDIAPDTSLNMSGKSLPTIPSKPGYAFMGWNSQPDGSGFVFDADYVLKKGTGILNVYAIWAEASVKVDFDANNNNSVWRKEEVTGNVTAILPKGSTSVQVTVEGNVVANLTDTKGDGTYTGTYIFEHNNAAAKAVLTAIGPDGSSISKDFSTPVTWIDEDAPVINGIKPIPGIAQISDFSGIEGEDVPTANANRSGTSSGVVAGTEEFRFYRVINNGTALDAPKTVAKSALNDAWLKALTPGRYFYDVVAEDGVGYKTYASDTWNPGTQDLGTGKGENNGNLIGEDPKGPNIGIIINADTPKITLKPQTDPNSAGWYKEDVTVDVDAKDDSSKLMLDVVTVNDGSKDMTLTLPFEAGKSDSYKGTFKAVEEGIFTFTGDVETEAGMKASTTQIIRLDKTKPEIKDMPKTGDDIGSGNIKITDPKPAGGQESGVAKELYTATLSGTTTTYSEDTLADLIDSLPTGVFDLKVQAWDTAGNEADPEEVKGLTNIKTGDSVGIVITYSPNGWTNQDVTATIKVVSPVPVTKVTVDGKVVPLDTNNETKYIFTENKSDVSVDVETIVPVFTGHEDMEVNWIDKVNPKITNLPVADANDRVTADQFEDDVDFTDYGSPDAMFGGHKESGIKARSETLYLYKITNGNVSATPDFEFTWAQLAGTDPFAGVTPGRYFYDIVVEDNAGNVGKASDAFGGNLIKEDGGDSGSIPGGGNKGKGKGVLFGDAGATLTIDVPAPTVTIGGIDWYKGSVKVTFTMTNTEPVKSAAVKDIGAAKKTSIATNALSTFVGKKSATVSATEKESGIHEYEVIVKDAFSDATATRELGVDAIAPKLSISKNTAGPLGTNMSINARDDESDLADIYKVTVKGPKNGTFTGSKDDMVDWLDLLPAGTYDVTMTTFDNVGYESAAAKGKFTHEPSITPVTGPDRIDLDYTPDDNGGTYWTSGDVEAEIVVVWVSNAEKITKLTVDGVAVTFKDNKDGSYTATTTRKENGPFNVEATTDKGNKLTKQGEVTWIDRAAPSFSNFPKPAERILTFPELAGIKIKDEASPKGTASQVDTSTPRVVLYRVSASGQIALKPAYDFDLAAVTQSDWDGITSGLYMLDVIASDLSDEANEGKASQNGLVKGNGTQGPTPFKPGDIINPDEPYIINPKVGDITLVITGTKPLLPAGNGWINKDALDAAGGAIEVSYTATTDPNAKITLVTTNSTIPSETNFPASSNPFNGKFKVNESGTYIVEATDSNGKKATATITVKIDKELPYADGITSGQVVDLSLVEIKDDRDLGGNDSGPDVDKSTFVAVDEDGNKFAGSFDELKNLPAGKYDIEIVSYDKAGNKNTEKFTEVEVEGPDVAADIEIDVKYDINTWTNKDITATITITSKTKLERVEVMDGATVVQTETISGTLLTYTFDYKFTKNESLTIEVDAKDLGGSTKTETKALSTIYIDRYAPVVMFDTAATIDELSKVNVLSAVEDVTAYPAGDNGMSGLKTITVRLVSKSGGAIAQKILQGGSAMSMPAATINTAIKELLEKAEGPGEFRIEAIAEDNAGNVAKVVEPAGVAAGENASKWLPNKSAAKITDVKYAGATTIKPSAALSLTIITAQSGTVTVDGSYVFSTSAGSKTGVGGTTPTTFNKSGQLTIKMPTATQAKKGQSLYINIFSGNDCVKSFAIRVG